MSVFQHVVTLNIAARPHDTLPDPSNPYVVLIDDKPIEGVTAVKVSGSAREVTKVTIEFYASVKGKVGYIGNVM